MSPRSVMLAAGEASGDQHAAAVARALLRQDSELSLFGMGSSRMRAEGVEILIDAAPLAVVGLSEVITHYPALRRALNLLKTTLTQRRPDLLILIDNPEFNLRLAKTATRLGIPVLYYISPQIWAWRRGRVKGIEKCVNKMAVVFPFEEPFYREAGMDVRFVGHPLLDEIPAVPDRAVARKALGLPDKHPVVGLFPGSRRGEIDRLMPILMDTARTIHGIDPNVQFLLPIAPSIARTQIEPFLKHAMPLIVLDESGDIYRSIAACDAIAACSGTVSLQIGLMGVPMAIFYRVSRLSYAIGSRLIRVDHISLPNIVLGQRAVQEFVQQEATAENIAAEILHLLREPTYAAGVRASMSRLREKLGSGGAALRVAQLAVGMLGRKIE